MGHAQAAKPQEPLNKQFKLPGSPYFHGHSLARTGPKLGPACRLLFSIHVCLFFSGRFSIKDVVPNKEGESSKIKVKVRLDIHGVLNVVNASLVEKLAAAPEPEVESMEVEGQDEKAKEATGDAASEVEVLDVLNLPVDITFIATLITSCIVHYLFP